MKKNSETIGVGHEKIEIITFENCDFTIAVKWENKNPNWLQIFSFLDNNVLSDEKIVVIDDNQAIGFIDSLIEDAQNEGVLSVTRQPKKLMFIFLTIVGIFN